MTPNEQLYNKLSAEFDAYVAGLKALPPEKIIENAYEKVFKEDILMSFESSNFDDDECAALLALDSPLDELYRNWLDTDVSYMDDLSDTIYGFISREMKRGKDVESATVMEVVSEPVSMVMPEPDTSTHTVMAVNGELHINDWVVVNPNEEYGGLIGQVTAIEKLGSYEHDTENVTDDVHVSFITYGYPEKDEARILDGLRKMQPELNTLDDFSLDDVIMAPESLVSLTGNDIERGGEFFELRENANDFLRRYFGDKENDLIDRIEKNYSDYNQLISGFAPAEIIDMAAKIHAVSDAYSYMTSYHGFSDEEIEFYLQFANPLEVVADAWHERNIDLDEMSFTMDFLSEPERQASLLTQYPLASEVTELDSSGLRRFMNVNLYDFLGKIAEQTIIHYPNDWKYDRDTLWENAQSDNPEDKRVVWHVCSYSTNLKNERDVFVRDSGAYEYMTDYRQNDPDMFGYVIEITGKRGGAIYGNVFEVGDYAEYAKHIRDTALPLESVTLTYSDQWGVNAGKAITVPRLEYDNDRRRLMSESGSVTAVRFNPSESVQTMSALLQSERSRRMAYPIGSQQAHLDEIAARIAEVRKPQEKSEPTKELSAFEKSLNRGKAKVAAYKAEQAQNPANKAKNNKEERS
jgi:hypothetical protein